MELLKGAEVSAAIGEEVKRGLEGLGGYVPTLAMVRVGEQPGDLSYERGAAKKLKGLGLNVRSFAFPQDIGKEEFEEKFRQINEEPEIDGILLFRPLPPHLDEKAAAAVIDPGKDVDGISPVNIAKVFSGDASGFAPCTAEAVMEILKEKGIPLRGAQVTVVGRSMVVGRPLAMLLLAADATVTVCHTKTRDLKALCRQAQILVAAAGRAKMVGGDYVGQGAVVIDVGINVDENGKLCGDVDAEQVKEKAAALTPVPGGVGAVTTAVLAKHLVQAAGKGRKGVFEGNGYSNTL